MSVKFKVKHDGKSFDYFIAYVDCDVVRPLCIMLPQMSRFIRYSDNSGKNMLFTIKDDKVMVKNNEIWDKECNYFVKKNKILTLQTLS